jgi:hypothetical protein
VHFAVNCASIGCPALREEAFVAARLDAQMDEQTLRFMSDRTRNRYNAQRGRLELSKIFDWYGEDFRLGHRGMPRCRPSPARYADSWPTRPADRERIRAGGLWTSPSADYDWALNDADEADAPVFDLGWAERDLLHESTARGALHADNAWRKTDASRASTVRSAPLPLPAPSPWPR